MIELIKDNYLCAYGTGKSWHVTIDPPKRKVKSYFEETLVAAEHMYSNKTGKIHLMYSGGLDSQYLFNVFQKLKFDFTPVIIRYVGRYCDIDYNAHDTQYAFNYCKSQNIEPTVIKFNFDDFIEGGEVFKIMEEAECCAYTIPAIMKVASQIDGFTVWGDAPPYIRYNSQQHSWELEEEEKYHSILKFYRKRNMQGCPFMLNYSSEMMLSFLLDSQIIALANNQFPGKLGTHSSKTVVYNRGSNFDLDHYNFETKSRIKATGYEVIVEKTPLPSHPGLEKYKDTNPNRPWAGCYREDYHQVVKRLSIHQ